MALVNYSSSSSDSETDIKANIGASTAETEGNEEPDHKKCKLSAPTTKLSETRLSLPRAITLLGQVKKALTNEDEDENDDPRKHGGRKRTFKHERGNWATYIFVPVEANTLEDIQELCQSALEDVVDLQMATDLHISLSRTVVLQYHLIDSFAKSLEEAMETCSSVSLHNLKIYTNEEKTRTFIAFKVDDLYFDKVHRVMSQVDSVLRDYKLQLFYEDPSFHISFLWCLGDNVDVLNSNLDKLVSAVNSLYEREALRIHIGEIHCKTGNKDFTFKLK